MDKITVLYVSIDPTMGGATASLYNLIEGIKDTVSPIVLFPEYGIGYDYFTKHGIKCYIHPFVKLYQFKKNRFCDVWTRPWRWHPIKKLRIDIGCARFMKKQLQGQKIDIVHTNTSPNDVGIYLAKLLHSKHVWHVRECLDLHLNVEIYGGMPKLISKINHADARIAVSSFVAAHWKMKQESTYIIHDAARSKLDAEYVPLKDKFVLFVSYNITEQKGARLAVEAFGKSDLCKEGIELLLVGNCEEDYKQSLLETAVKCGCERNVRFLPCQSDVKPFFLKAMAFVMASRAEGFSRVVSEAMFFGCPVLAYSESGGALEQVKDGETGYVFSSIEECAALLRKVYMGDNEGMILCAQEFVKSNLSQEVYGPKIKGVYRTVLGRMV